jgi:hypothetical protein
MTRPYSETLAAAEGGVPRHYCRCKDCEFTEPLPLPGFEDRSVWGFDNRRGSFFAQLWPNGSRSGNPHASLPADERGYWWPSCLALDIVAVTKMEPTAVLAALVLLDPASAVRPTSELEGRVETPAGVSADYRDGYRRALRWVLGTECICPGSRRSWPGERPTAQIVDAECQLLSGRVYSHELHEILTQQFNGGGEAALLWALGRRDVSPPATGQFAD